MLGRRIAEPFRDRVYVDPVIHRIRNGGPVKADGLRKEFRQVMLVRIQAQGLRLRVGMGLAGIPYKGIEHRSQRLQGVQNIRLLFQRQKAARPLPKLG